MTESGNEDAAKTFVEQCEQDYEAGEITAVVHERPAAPDLALVFAVAELMPPWLERNPNIGHSPPNGGYPRLLKLGSRAGNFHVQRWRLPVKDTVSWYRSCLEGSTTVPGYNKTGTAPPHLVPLPPMDEDPDWPRHVVEDEKFWGGLVPFWGARPGGSRWHRLLPQETPELIKEWSPEDIDRARALLRKEIHIDPLARSVMWGSCHLVLPNPLYARSAFRVRDDWRSVELELTPHPGRHIEGLELIVWSQRAWGATAAIRKAISAPRTIVALPEGVECTARAIVCPTRGLLEKTTETPFLAGIRMGLHMITEQRRVEVPARSRKRPIDKYVVGVAGPGEETMAGTEREPRAAQRLTEDELNVKARKAWDDLKIQWLDKDVEHGRDEIRKLVGSANQSVDFIDPYFGPEDLLSFPPATSIRNLPVRILTAADFCGDPYHNGLLENGEVLLSALQSIRRQATSLNIEIKVMPGAKSPVHDRFLIIDGWVWVLGASLNEFGERGTLLLRLPQEPRKEIGDPESLSISRDVFEAQWSRSEVETLAAFVTRRALERRAATFSERLEKTLERCRNTYRQIARIWRA